MAYEIFETCLLVPGIGRAECASWVQAWGSILAILSGIWLANAENRRRKRAALDVAEVVAATVIRSLGPLQGGVQEILSRYESMAKFDGAPETFSDLSEMLKRLPLPSQEQVMALSPLRNSVARRLSESCAHISLAIIATDLAAETPEIKTDGEKRKEYASHEATLLRPVVAWLARAESILDDFLDKRPVILHR